MRPFAVTFVVAAALLAAFGSVGAAPVPKHLIKEPESDKAKLQGKWKVESMRIGGKDVFGELGVKFEMEFEFKDNALIMNANIAGMVQKTTATATYGTGATKQIQMTNPQTVDGTGKPMNNGEKDGAFGYAFDGEKLLIGATGNGESKAVDPLKPGPNDAVIVLTRVK